MKRFHKSYYNSKVFLIAVVFVKRHIVKCCILVSCIGSTIAAVSLIETHTKIIELNYTKLN